MQSPQTPQVTRECFLRPAKGRDLLENPAPAPGTWHAWKYIWREGRISIWKKELTWEEIGRLLHDTNMKSTFMNMGWVGESRNTQMQIPHLQMQIYFACRTNAKGTPGPSSRNLQQHAWDAPGLLHQTQTLWNGDTPAGLILKDAAYHKSHYWDRNEGSSTHCLQHHLFLLFPCVKLCSLTHSHSEETPDSLRSKGALSVEGFSHVLLSFFKKIQAWSSKLNLLPWC